MKSSLLIASFVSAFGLWAHAAQPAPSVQPDTKQLQAQPATPTAQDIKDDKDKEKRSKDKPDKDGNANDGNNGSGNDDKTKTGK